MASQTQTQSSSAAAEFDFDAEMGMTLDELPDMPSIDPWVSGTYVVKLSTERKLVKMLVKANGDKEKKDYPCVQVNMVLERDPLEVDETSPGIVPKIGDKINVLCNLRMDMGKAALKTILGPIAQHAGKPGASLSELETLAQDAVIAVVVTARKNGDRINNNIKEAAMV